MSIFKSFWFWFAAAWFLAGAAGAVLVALELPPWTWIFTATAIVWVLVGTASTLLLRQRALIRSLSKGASSRSTDKFEESWKAGFSADVSKLLDGSAVADAVGKSSSIASLRLVWVVSADFDASRKLFEAAGAIDATQARSHELSGELPVLCDLLSRKEEIFVLLKELPDPRVPATLSRTRFLLELFAQRGKSRPVDAVIALSPLQKESIPPAIQVAIQFLAGASGIEFPVHLGLHGSDALPGGRNFFRVCPEPPGATLPWTRQEDLPKGFDLAWARMESDLDSMEGAILACAWEKSQEPPAIFQFLESLRRFREPAKSAALSCASQFSGGPTPFLRGFYLLPSPQAGTDAKAQAKASAPPDALFFGAALFEDEPAIGPQPSTAPTSGDPVAALEFFLDHIQAQPPLARLGKNRQIRSSTLSVAIFAASLLASALLLWGALRGWVVGAELERGWQARLVQDGAAVAGWTNPVSMRSRLPALDDADRLLEQIEHGRPWLLAPGFYRDDRNLPKARALWDTLAGRLAREAFSSQEGRLRAKLSAGDSLDAKDLYGQLKTYLLSTRQGWAEGSSKEGTRGLAEAFERAWGDHLGFAGTPTPYEREVLSRVASHVARRVDRGDSSWLGAQDAQLVARARELLRGSRNQNGTYGQLLASADTLAKLDWDSLGLPQREITCRPAEIPSAFTRRGWQDAVQPTLKKMGEGGVDWVRGKDAAGGADAAVLAELERRYAEDFAAAWKGLLDTSSCTLPSENQRLGSALAMLSSPYNRQNPKGIPAFFQRVLEETDLSPAKDTGKSVLPAQAASAARKGAQAVEAIERMAGGPEPVPARVARSLSGLRALASDAGKGALDPYLKDLSQLGGLFNQWGQNDGALAFAKGVTSQDARNPLVHAWNEAVARRDLLPAELRPWFQGLTLGILRQAAASAFPQARTAASADYRDKVLQPWRNLSKGSYPFDPYAENEASIADIDALLNPKSGSLANFLRDMDGLVQVRDDELRAVSAMGMGLSLDPQASEQVGKLLRISEFFYGKGGASWKGVAASISARADSRAHVVLRLGAQVLDIPNGTERKLTTRWPQPGQDGATLQATTVNRTFEEKREGQWALLRLMESRTPGSPEATWSFNDRSYIVDIPVSVKLDAIGGPFQDREFLHVALLQDLFL